MSAWHGWPTRLMVSTGLAAMCTVGHATPATAQIYSWRDGSGTLVLSDRLRTDGSNAGVRTHAVPAADVVRTVRPSAPAAPTAPAATTSTRFDDVILEQARLNNVRPNLVRAVVQVESAFNPYAQSPKGAIGLMQLMPATARELGVINPFDPEQNVRGGTTYLRQLLDRYGGDERLALAAYNAGPGAVDRHGQTVPPYSETRNYVQKVGQVAGAPEPGAALPTSVIRKSFETTTDGRRIPLYTNIKSSR